MFMMSGMVLNTLLMLSEIMCANGPATLAVEMLDSIDDVVKKPGGVDRDGEYCKQQCARPRSASIFRKFAVLLKKGAD
ncbi:hypothetical protein KIN20_017404 [Parelaphostrongylus tenuis]|uniref:Secreted protein n=1 Tax=Parelaphostrongylus tenuis TaxID=148309 RepID=A0AAD5N2I6_PARTN|nr:hypothetical protein KIN20_017404 [Parelaphostrongylus tenuis]